MNKDDAVERREYDANENPYKREAKRKALASRQTETDGLARSKVKDIINAHVAECFKAAGVASFIPRHPGPAADAILTALSKTRVDALEEVVAEARFLCDRLDQMDWSQDYEDFANDYNGHVSPSHSRLKGNLKALKGSDHA